MVADAQAWLDTPATNFGWILIGNEAQLKTAKRFNSRENPNSSNRPVLTLDYFPPGPTPTPTPTYSPTPTPIGTPTPTPSPVPTATPTPTPEPTATPLPPLTVVPPAEIKAPDVEHGTVVVVQPTSGASVAFPEQGLELQIPAFAQQATLQVLVRSPDVAELPVTADTEVLRAVGIEFFDASGTPKQNVRLWLSARLDFALTDAQIDRIGGLSAVLSEFAAGRIRIRRFSAANAGQLTNLNATFDLITRTFSASTAQFSVFVLTWDREARSQATPTATPTAPPSPTATMTPAPTLTPTVTFTGLVPETGGFSVSRAALSKMLLLGFLLLAAGIFLGDVPFDTRNHLC